MTNVPVPGCHSGCDLHETLHVPYIQSEPACRQGHLVSPGNYIGRYLKRTLSDVLSVNDAQAAGP